MRHGGTQSMVINGNIRGYYEISTAGTSGTDGSNGCSAGGGMSAKSFADEGLLNKVKERGTLLVGLEGTYPPFSFQGDDGKLTGFEVDFAEALAKHLGVKALLKPTKWDGILASLDAKRIDVVINRVTISDVRKKNMISLRLILSPAFRRW